jgi:hypothetical protein
MGGNGGFLGKPGYQGPVQGGFGDRITVIKGGQILKNYAAFFVGFHSEI